jgi:serine-type D-Ala-D-Ala carboxypeptidase/endopeptidase
MNRLGPLVDAAVAKPGGGRGRIGLVVGVIAGDDEWVAGYGRARLDGSAPPGRDTVFEIGSITKVFTAVALADLAEQGIVRLEDPLRSHLPASVRVPVHPRGEIALHHLASHTSGLPREARRVYRLALRDFRNAFSRLTREDVFGDLARTKLRRPPGRRYRYSNLGAGLLGHALEHRSGLAYEELVRRRVLAPLGLESTFIEPPAKYRALVARGYTRRRKPVPPWSMGALEGAGALRSTAADMLVFLRANLEPSQMGGRLARALALTHQPRVKRSGISVGLGWHRLPLRRKGVETIWHNGGTGGFRSFAGFVPESRTAVVALANTNRLVDGLAIELLRALNP